MDVPTQAEIVIVGEARLPDAPGERVFSAYPIDEAALEDAIRLDDALRQAPGVSLFRRNGSAAANPTIQGLGVRSIGPSGAGRALVTLDGVPQHDPFGGWVIWGALPSETIAGASIVRGAGAGPYGAGALTGAVSLHERSAPGFTLSAEGGELGFSRVAGVGEAQDGNLDFMLAAAAEHSDGWIPVRAGRGAADAPLWSDALSGVARVQMQSGRVTTSLRASAYGEDRGSGLVGGDSSASGASLSFTAVAAPRPDQAGWRLQAWARSSDMSNTFLAVGAGRNTVAPASEQYATPSFGWGANAAMRWGDDARGLEIGADVRAADGETRELFFFSGGQFTRSRVAGGETLVAGAYAESWRTVGPWLVAGGVRLDTWQARDGIRLERNLLTGAATLDVTAEDSDATTPTARIGVRREFGPLFVRSALYAGFRPPTLNELHRPFRVGNDVTEANPLLQPEELYGFDAAIGGEHGDVAWSLGAFVTRLEDPITNVTLGMGPGTFPPGVSVPAGGAYRQRQNAGHIDAQGIEAEAHGDFGERLAWRAAVNYTHARVDGASVAPQLTDLRPAQTPVWTITAGGSWRITDATTLSADVLHESARFEDDLNSRTLDGATSFDLRFEQAISETATLFAALDNANDAAIATAVTADGVESYAAPRAFRVGVKLRR